jgi:DNA-directed RNA polymerase specialized sigma54-like protein
MVKSVKYSNGKVQESHYTIDNDVKRLEDALRTEIVTTEFTETHDLLGCEVVNNVEKNFYL